VSLGRTSALNLHNNIIDKMGAMDVVFATAPRLLMGPLFLAAGICCYPAVTNYHFTCMAWFFEVGSWCFFIAATQELLPQLKSFSAVPAMNAFMYVAASVLIMIGSLWFLPNVQAKFPHPDLGQQCYTAATVVIISAVLWDMSRLLLVGAKPILQQILAMTSALAGAICFLLGAYSVYSQFWKVPGAFERGATFFVVGSIFFIVHGISVTSAVLHFTSTASTPNGDEEEQDEVHAEDSGEKEVDEKLEEYGNTGLTSSQKENAV
jgi:hypothetical protein